MKRPQISSSSLFWVWNTSVPIDVQQVLGVEHLSSNSMLENYQNTRNWVICNFISLAAQNRELQKDVACDLDEEDLAWLSEKYLWKCLYVVHLWLQGHG